jgi:pimeloyl-ACP methyl ester carboxylesterase
VIAAPAPQTVYLEGVIDPVFAVFHAVTREGGRDTAVILCPPFGWDEVCSYRSRREWALRLAEAGYPSIRPSFPATGDSGGAPRDSDRLDAWTAAVTASARWVRAATGAQRLVAIGLGLGGLIAYRAAAGGAPIDDLVLWATPARGRTFVRQFRAFSRLEASQFFEGLEAPAPLPPDELEAGGFLLSAQTVRELDSLDLTALALPAAAARRVMLLDRDGIAVDSALREQLESWGVAVTVAAGPGYATMTSHPQQARAPLPVIDAVMSWLDEASTLDAAPTDPTLPLPAGASDGATMADGDSHDVVETPFTVEQSFGKLSGVLVEPLGRREPGLCAVLLNAGAGRRIGPSRMWVEAARRWALLGVPTLRLDVEGIGEADGAANPYGDDGALYVPTLIPQVLAAVDALQERGIGERFVLGGLCAGAYWSLHAALLDDRVRGALVMNPRALVWDPRLLPARDFRALLFESFSWAKLKRSVTKARVRALALWMLASPKRLLLRLRARLTGTPTDAHEIDDVLTRLGASGKLAMMMFSDDEPLHEELVRSGRMAWLEQMSNVTVEHINVRDHTLRPNSAQREAHQALDRAIDRELAITRVPAPAAPPS